MMALFGPVRGIEKPDSIDNSLTDENGEKVRLKKGAEVDVTVEAGPEATTICDGQEEYG